MTLGQMVGQIQMAIQSTTDDSIFDERYIIDLINNNREVALRNEYNRMRSVHPSTKQQICVPLELVDSATCCSGILTGCLVLRSTFRLPDTIELHQKDGILEILPTALMAKKINYTTIDRAPFVGRDALTSKMVFAFLYDGYLYIWSKDKKHLLMESVTVIAMFSDPIKAGNYACATKDCFTLESDYPVSATAWETLIKPQTINTLLRSLNLPIDNTNNGKDDQTEIPPPTKKAS